MSTGTLAPEEMLRMYEAGDSLRVIARRDGRTYEGVRRAMMSAPGGAERVSHEMARRSGVRLARRIARDEQRAAARKRSRTLIPASTNVHPLPPKRTRGRFTDEEILSSVRQFLLDPDAYGRGTGAYDRWREVRAAHGERHPSSALARVRYGSWVSVKAWALRDVQLHTGV